MVCISSLVQLGIRLNPFMLSVVMRSLRLRWLLYIALGCRDQWNGGCHRPVLWRLNDGRRYIDMGPGLVIRGLGRLVCGHVRMMISMRVEVVWRWHVVR